MQGTHRFLKFHWATIVVAGVLLAVTIYSSLNLATTPKLWIDEALTVEMSRNLATQGTLNIQVAPGVFFDAPQLLQSTGYTVTYPLAATFTLFGVGATQERAFMLLWLLGTLLLTYFVTRSLFGTSYALGGLLLLSSFATLYADGRTATGEIPGFFFLMAGIYFLLLRPVPLLAGLLFGFAVVTKPSIFLLLIPTLLLTILFQKNERFADKVRTLVQIGIGALVPALLWLALSMPDPWNPHAWSALAAFYHDPYSAGTAPSFLKNIFAAIHSTTILYFGTWAALIGIVRSKITDARQAFFYTFTLFYSAFAFLYYLRSPGWLRYIFAGELLLLLLLPHALETFARTYRRFVPKLLIGKETTGAVLALVILQIVQLSFFSNMFSSDQALHAATYINQNEPGASVLTFQALEVSVLLDTEQRYNSVALTGIPALDTNPLSEGILPDLVVGASDNPHLIESHDLLARYYAPPIESDGLLIYKRIP